jgi:hypothetical protein
MSKRRVRDAHWLTKIAHVGRLVPIGYRIHTDWTVWWPDFLGGNFASIFFFIECWGCELCKWLLWPIDGHLAGPVCGGCKANEFFHFGALFKRFWKC